MKYLKNTIIFSLFLLSNPVFSQEVKKEDCQDIVYLNGGSVLRGKITEYKIDGDLVMNTWSGAQMRLPAVNVKRIVQKCKGDARESGSWLNRPYSFNERGWYHATRVSALTGASGLGFSFQHSSGYKFNRFIGAGIGIGIENFEPFDRDVATFPIFAELRGYLLSRNITPFYALGVGYGFSKRESSDVVFDAPTERWKGGLMLQGHIGYRIGNHAFVQLGIRLQHKTREWENNFWGSTTGIDQILHKRFDIGIGLIL